MPMCGNTNRLRQLLRCGKMSPWVSKKATQCCSTSNIKDTSIRPYLCWRGQYLEAKVAWTPTSYGNTYSLVLLNLHGCPVSSRKPSVSLPSSWIRIVSMAPWHNVYPPSHLSRALVDQIYFIGDSRSASELEVFINMPIERLRVGCGLQCTLPHVPLGPSSRSLLFSAAVKLLKFAMSSDSCCTNNAAEEALWHAMSPLLCNPDEHVLATIGSLVLALIEGRTDLPISGVFGAGKTRSAAILVVGLLVFEPSLNLMILTKENVAAQAFAEHIEALKLPPSITSKIGRLVGYMELKKNKTNKTSLDVTCENRHEVLRQKKLYWLVVVAAFNKNVPNLTLLSLDGSLRWLWRWLMKVSNMVT